MKKVPWLIAALTILALAPARAAERSYDRVGRGPAIELYAERGYRGAMQIFFAEEFDLRSQGFNDLAQSARVRGARAWRVCEHAGLGGRCVTLTGDNPDLASVGLSRRISSLQPAPDLNGRGEPGLRLFEAEGLSGRTYVVRDPQANLDDVGFNDRARSLTARGRWEVCEHHSFGGRCRIVQGEIPDLRAIGLWGQISSARPAESGAGPHYPAPPPRYDYARPDAVGRTAAFFVQPRASGREIAACGRNAYPGRDCAQATADAFCRAQNYRSAAYFSFLGAGREILDDILCIR